MITRHGKSDMPYNLTEQQALWLAFRLGELQHTSGLVTSGRDVMRVIHARWEQMGLPTETLADYERDILGGDHPFGMGVWMTITRAIRALAGDCPVEDIS